MSHRKLTRSSNAREAAIRDYKLMNSPDETFAQIRGSKRHKLGNLNKLVVGSVVYTGDAVNEGFYTSIEMLKSRDSSRLLSSAAFQDFSKDYENIIKLAQKSPPIKPITEVESFNLLLRMKSNVCDLYNITPSHYINAGPIGYHHFHLLLSTLLSDISSMEISEVNAAYACVLFKGHGKDKSSSRSYRTISTCPLVAKALDMYIRDLYMPYWKLHQSPVQFQGEGRSHEMAGLLLTECIQYSRFSLQKPIFVLYLDARSAFDVVQKELLLKNLFNVQPLDQSFLYLNNRLQNRTTYVDYNGCIMGPILDEQGLEQGGVSSSELYKIFGREQLDLAQNSSLGVQLGNLVVSSIGQADDTVLISNDIHYLFFLLQLTNIYCDKNQVQLCAEKSQLQVFHSHKRRDDPADTANPINIQGKSIPFTNLAEHVGILRSTDSNRPTLIARFAAHKRALSAVLHTGLALGHRANPISGLKVHQLYAVPVLLSGLAALPLSSSDIDMVEKHYCETLRSLLRLLPKTPRSVVYFLAGSLPGCALVHQRQLMLFGMISRLKSDILHQHASNIYESRLISKKSWFHTIRALCVMYDLPHPSMILQHPMEKENFKNFVKKKIISYWERKLRSESATLSSLSFFQPAFMSISKPHPLWWTAGPSPSKVSMANIQAVMLSGRYRTQSLIKHWNKNIKGNCLLSPQCHNTCEDIPHILQHCPALSSARERLLDFTVKYCSDLPALLKELILRLCRPSNALFSNFLLDCSSLPDVISCVQTLGSKSLESFFDVTRMWIYVLHRERLRRLGRWKPSW